MALPLQASDTGWSDWLTADALVTLLALTTDFTTDFTTGFTTAGFGYGVERLADSRRARDFVRSSGKKPAVVSRVCVCVVAGAGGLFC